MSSTLHPSTRTLVLALGNPLRADDGVGLAVLDTLRDDALPPETDLVDGGTSGLELVLTLAGYPRAIIIDAADMGLTPGAWRQFSLDDVLLGARDPHLSGTMHYAGLAEALVLAEALGQLPQQIVVFGVQPETTDWEPGLSAPVQAAIEGISAEIKELLAERIPTSS
ncbi:MAG: hydrogenase maturation protease [Anaerolineae bacterium]|nr:hydrogenase maturation protease [Anaerolineae bacterium]